MQDDNNDNFIPTDYVRTLQVATPAAVMLSVGWERRNVTEPVSSITMMELTETPGWESRHALVKLNVRYI